MRSPVVIEKLDELAELLSEARTLAVVGLSANPARDSHSIASYLQLAGYDIVGVNPAHKEILGRPCYPSLTEVPEELRKAIDLVVVFRKPEAVPPIIEEAARLGMHRVWLQIGVASPAALETAAGLEVGVVPNKCIRVVHSLVRDRIGRPAVR